MLRSPADHEDWWNPPSFTATRGLGSGRGHLGPGLPGEQEEVAALVGFRVGAGCPEDHHCVLTETWSSPFVT